MYWGFPHSLVGKESACNAGDPGSIPGWGRSGGEGIGYPLQYSWAFIVAQLVKNPPTMQESWVRSLGWEDPLEKGKATHSSTLARRIPWTLQSKESTKSWIWLSDFHFHFYTSIKLILKLGQKIWTLQKTGYPNDQQTSEQVLSLISNHRNADKHNNVKSLHAHWIIKIIKT